MRRWGTRSGALVLAAIVLGCARTDGDPPDADRPLHLSFEDTPAPAAFEREAPAVRDREGGADGLWAAVPGLPRPERAVVVNLETGAEVVVALFAAGSGPEIRLSNAAADALGVATGPTRVRVTALRSRPSIDTTRGRL